MKKSKNNSISEGDLFLELSKRSNSLPESTVKEVYYGLIKVIIDQFRAGRDITLPGLGKFYISESNTRLYNINTKTSYSAKLRKVVFLACGSFKKYINEMIIKTNVII